MFRKRLTWFWILLSGVALLIMGRLAQIQLVRAAEFQKLADRILTRRPVYIAAPRGTIFDRNGVALLRDEPTYDVSIHYGALTDRLPLRESYLLQAARALRKRGDYPADMRLREIAKELPGQIEDMWRRLSELTGLTESELMERADRVRKRIERWRAAAGQPIREEKQLLPVLEHVDHDAALAVRLELEQYPWLRVMPSSRRVACQADALVHVLGRMGAASPDRIADDPLHDDELRRLRPGDRCGTSGVERLAETALRGWRGRIIEDYDWRVLERTDPVAGRDVYLTIDLALQRQVVKLLEEAVREHTDRTGAAAVIIDVATREVRALASYPTYCYDSFNEQYEQLRRDAKRLPLMFRAVQAQYPPGSICKAIALIGGLSEEVLTAETRIHCTGHLLPDKPDKFRCWIYNLNPGITHDMTDNPAGQEGESAVRNSCNIYFYKVGGMLGPQRLCEWFSRFGLGRPAGTGLIEESRAIVPTEQWLLRHVGRRHRKADAWNFAIGQGEVTITPLQAANVAAAVASGLWAPVRLAYDQTGHAFGAPPAPPTSFNEDHLKVLRRGMWRVVNERGGTGKWAKLDHHDYDLCGKTGSAQAQPRPVTYRYTFEWPDGHREEVTTYLEEDALAQLDDEKPKRVGKHTAVRYPAQEENERLPSHAWFIGYTQPVATPAGGAPTGKVYAISVIVEFGGSGGRVAGPVAKKIAECLLNTE